MLECMCFRVEMKDVVHISFHDISKKVGLDRVQRTTGRIFPLDSFALISDGKDGFSMILAGWDSAVLKLIFSREAIAFVDFPSATS